MQNEQIDKKYQTRRRELSQQLTKMMVGGQTGVKLLRRRPPWRQIVVLTTTCWTIVWQTNSGRCPRDKTAAAGARRKTG
jgi:hypothetical protein